MENQENKPIDEKKQFFLAIHQELQFYTDMIKKSAEREKPLDGWLINILSICRSIDAVESNKLEALDSIISNTRKHR